MKNIRKISRAAFAALSLSAFLMVPLAASAGIGVPFDAGDKYKMDINITGMVVATGSCTFKAGGTSQVNFGDVHYSILPGTNSLDGKHIQTLASGMTCNGDTAGKAQMKLDTTVGSAVTYQGATLLPIMMATGTQSKSLGIRLLADGTIQNTGKWFSVDLQKLPLLEVELVQTGDGSDFFSGEIFTAAATLTMAFN